MSGIICCACSFWAILVLQFVLLPWKSELNKIQEKNESQQNQDLWWILLRRRHRSCRLQLQWAWGRNIPEVKIPGIQLLKKRTDCETRCRQRSKDCIWWPLSWAIHGKFALCKLLKMFWWPCLAFSRVENWYWDVRTTGETRCNFLVSDTRIPTWFSHEETQHDGTVQSVVSEVVPRERSERPDVDSQQEARPQQFVIGNDEAELELSVESWSLVDRVNDQVRKCRISNVTENGEKHSTVWWMFMTAKMESAVLMRKNYQNNCHSLANTKDLTPRPMFDISSKLVSELLFRWKPIRTISEFLDLISRFEFGFRRREIWCVLCMCCACLHPHNSNSNVVTSVAIHDDMQSIIPICKYIKNVAKPWNHCGRSCKSYIGGGGRGARGQTEPCHTPQFLPGLLKLNSFIKHSEWLGESVTSCSRSILKRKMCKIHWFLWWTSGAKRWPYVCKFW